MNSQSYTDGQPIILAHRGGAGEAAENSIEAFTSAVKLGSKYLETDVLLGLDGRLHLHHGSFTLAHKRVLPADTPYPTLEALFRLFPDSYFCIDPKHEAAVEPLAQLIAAFDMVSQICINTSSDQRAKRVADRVKELSGQRPVVALASARACLLLLAKPKQLRGYLQQLEAAFIDVPKRLVKPKTIQAAHEAELKLIAWTVNDEATMRRFLEWGVDGFMTDYPSVALKVQHDLQAGVQ